MRSSIYLIMIRAHIRSSLLFFLVACSRRLSVVFVVFGVFLFCLLSELDCLDAK